MLDRATRLAQDANCLGNHAFALYVSGELTALEDRLAAEARSVGATFVAGVASVALASIRTEVGDPAAAAAAAAFAELLEIWRRTGQAPQLWTTARNAAALLLAEGRAREAIHLATHADRSPDAAAIDETIAEHTGIARTAGADVLDAEQLVALQGEADAMSTSEVLDSARLALLELASKPAVTPDPHRSP